MHRALQIVPRSSHFKTDKSVKSEKFLWPYAVLKDWGTGTTSNQSKSTRVGVFSVYLVGPQKKQTPSNEFEWIEIMELFSVIM